MRIPLKFAELHAPLFLAGTNLQQKLDPEKRTDMALEYDDEEKHLLVFFKEAVAIVPSSTVLSMTPTDCTMFGERPLSKPQQIAPKVAPAGPIKAQVSGPHDHVFQGPGAGKTK